MKLRLINAVLYTAIALLAASIIGAPLRLALKAITQRYSYTPNLEGPWVWVLLGLMLVVAIASTAGRLVQGRRAGLIRYAMLIGVLAMAFAARKLVPAPSRPTITDALSHLMARSELAADAAFSKEKRYPVEVDALTPQWADEIRDMGYFRRGGRLLRSRLFVVMETFGPALVAPEGARPGDVVFAVSSDRKRYWMTAFVLDRAGRLSPFTDSAGRAIVASAFDGRPASRSDPLFPEYPNKVPHTGAPFPQ